MIKYIYKSQYKDLIVITLFTFLIEFTVGLLGYDLKQDLNSFYKLIYFTSFFSMFLLSTIPENLLKPVHLEHYLTLGYSRDLLYKTLYSIQVPIIFISLIPGVILLFNYPQALLLKIIFSILLLPLTVFKLYNKKYDYLILAFILVFIFSKHYIHLVLVLMISNIYFIYKNKQTFTKGNLI